MTRPKRQSASVSPDALAAARPLRRPGDDDFPDPPEPPEPPPPRPPRDPLPPEPPSGPAPPRGDTSASITSWTRLEPTSRDAELRSTLGARVFDPLWMLTRQWQMGEFQGEDTGTPVRARVQATSAAFTRCRLGPLAAPPPNGRVPSEPFDVERMPLETRIERRRPAPVAAPDGAQRLLTLAVDGGLDFLRRLDSLLPAKTAATYRAAFAARFALQMPAAGEPADDSAAAFLHTMAGRALDARRLAAALHADGAGALARDPALKIAAGDRAEVEQAASRWLSEHEGLFSEPAGAADDAWVPERLEYAAAIAARLSDAPDDDLTLAAGEFDDGRLDWSRFDVDTDARLDLGADQRIRKLDASAVPAPVTLRGVPAPRFWELEDARLDYGLMPVGPTDLAQLLAIEYAGSWGNDWFVVPLVLPVGSATRIDSLVVTDSFGVRSLLRPIGDAALAAAHWSMWQTAPRQRAATETPGAPLRNLFVLPPTVGHALDGAPLEDLLFLRDEMANLAWAIERSVESATETASPRAEAGAAPPAATGEVPRDDGRPPAYRLASRVPAHWVPLLPVQLRDEADGRTRQRLKRGAVLAADGSRRLQTARGDLLAASPDGLLHDEEVPREGVHVTRLRRLARWIDGSTWLWVAHRIDIGRGEGSSGLVFDRLDDVQDD